MTNREFTKNEIFVKACKLAKIKPTIRQASKYLRNCGLAFAQRKLAITLVEYDKLK